MANVATQEIGMPSCSSTSDNSDDENAIVLVYSHGNDEPFAVDPSLSPAAATKQAKALGKKKSYCI